MNISVNDAAKRSGLSPRRIRELIASGRLQAERVGASWIIDEAVLASFEPRIGRPMSSRNAWGLAQLFAGEHPSVSPSELSRLRKRRNELVRADEDRVAQILRSWMAERAERRLYRVARPDLPSLLADDDLVVSGLSDPRSGLSAAGMAEGYVLADKLDALIRRHLLIEADELNSNVVLHVSDQPVEAVSPFLVAADLAEYNSPRENQRAAELVRA
ncbi:hypothetical protein BH09ACT10_BH09ACT10_11100 [soil metagenome]